MFDVIVVGAGLIGMLTARELQQRGVKVLLLERGRTGGESTWAGGGILSPLYPWRYGEAVNRLALAGHVLWPQLAEGLLADSGIDPEYTRSGLLVLDQHENAEARRWAQQADMPLELLADHSLRNIDPALHPSIQAALWLPEIAQVRNPRLIKSMLGSLQQRAISCVENVAVTSLIVQQGRVAGVQAGGENYLAGKVVIAGGAWSAGILQSITRSPQIEPVKGQMIIFKAEPGLLKSIVLSQGRYLIPRRDGRILAGSTLEHTGFDKTPTATAQQDLRQTAISLLPALADLPVEHHWAGLRPGSDQGIPYICPHPDMAGLYINSGHYRNGVILGAASARLMADLITQTTGAIDPAFYGFDAPH